MAQKDFIEFHSFPFDANAKMPLGAEIIMQACCGVLNDLNINYRVSDGTILGLYRAGEFIAHDNDIDVEVLDVNDKTIEDIDKVFQSNGMKLGRKVIYKGELQQLVYYTSSKVIFDIVVWHSSNEEDKIYNYSERDYERVQDAKYFQKKKLEHIEFKSNLYPMPTPVEDWLEMRYGKDWRIPKTYKGDWKDDCFDIKRMD